MISVDKGWSLNDSLHEITTVRSDMMSLSQPRPRAISRPIRHLTAVWRNKRKGKSRGKIQDQIGRLQTFHLYAPVRKMFPSQLQMQWGRPFFHFQIGHTPELHMVIVLVTFGTRCSSSYWTIAITSDFYAIFICIQPNLPCRNRNSHHSGTSLRIG